jgi:glycosyltransferase involved in cell wall biosynthesis
MPGEPRDAEDGAMRLLVAPHDLSLGGSQINAIDLAAGAAEAGHEVVVYGVPGPLVDYIEKRGLDFVPARRLRYRPAPSRVGQMATVARRRRIDLVHAYEWPPCLEAYYGAHLGLGLPLLCTVMSMTVSPLVPRSVPLVMGTAELGELALRTHRAPVWVLEPQIDTDFDHPGIDGLPFREQHGVAPETPLLVTVSRLAVDFKLDALVRLIAAVDQLAGRFPLRLLVVGGGPASDALKKRAARVNARWDREVVGFTGQVSDPRSAYAAADVVAGMGSSALRAMSIGRPLVVQGDHAFSEICEPATMPHFLFEGFWGHGDNDPTADRLAGQIAELLEDDDRRAALGAFGRRTVEERFSLPRAVELQLEIYGEVLAHGRSASGVDAATVAGRALQLELRAHDPRRKRARRLAEQSTLQAATRFADQPANA